MTNGKEIVKKVDNSVVCIFERAKPGSKSIYLIVNKFLCLTRINGREK